MFVVKVYCKIEIDLTVNFHHEHCIVPTICPWVSEDGLPPALALLSELNLLFLQQILHYIYNALVQSHFDYCSIVWGNCGKTLSEKLPKLQNRAARILTFSDDADAEYLLQPRGWKDLIVQREIQVALILTIYPLCLLCAVRLAIS